MSAATTAEVPRGRGLAINFLLLMGGECLAKACTFIAFVDLGRVLGPERYGCVEFVLATMVFFTLPVDFGIGIYGARELARSRARATDILRQVAATRLVLSLVSFFVLTCVALALPQPIEVRFLLLAFGLCLLAEPALVQWFFQGQELMHWVAAATLIRKGGFATLVFLLVRSDTPLLYVGLCEVVGVACTALFCLGVLRFVLGYPVPLPWVRPNVLYGTFREALPIGLSELACAFWWYFPTVLLGLLVGGESLGWFGASHRVVMALHTFVWLYFFNLLPALSRLVKGSSGPLRDLLHRSLEVTAWGGVFIALVATLAGTPILMLVFGPGFAESGRLLAILIWMIPLALISGHYRFTLVAAGLQKLEFYAALGAAVVAMLLTLVLIPWCGVLAAAYALVVATLVNLGWAYLFVRRHLGGISCHQQLVGPFLALGVSLGLFLVVDAVHHTAAVGVALLAYLIPLVWWSLSQLPLLFAPRGTPVVVMPE